MGLRRHNPREKRVYRRFHRSVLCAMAGRGGRSFLNLPTNSPAICEASEELPPLPISKILLPFLKDETISSETSLISNAYLETNSSLVLMLSAKSPAILSSVVIRKSPTTGLENPVYR